MAELFFPQIGQGVQTFDTNNNLNVIFSAMDKMTQLYYNNKASYMNNIESPLAKTQVRGKDMQILNDAKQQVDRDFAPIIEGDAFHKAGEVIDKTVRDISNNKLLSQATSDYARQQADNKTILEREGWSSDYKQLQIAYNEDSSQGVSIDPITGAVRSGYNPVAWEEGFDTKAIDELLETVSSINDYGVGEITSVQLDNLESKFNALGMSVQKDILGNVNQYGKITTETSELTKDRVMAVVNQKLLGDSKFKNFIGQKAMLEEYKILKAKAAQQGITVNTLSDLPKFTSNDVALAYDANSELRAQVAMYASKQGIKEDAINASTIYEYIMADIAESDRNSDLASAYLNSYISSSFRQGLAMSEISDISSAIGDRLAYENSNTKLDIISNNAYIAKAGSEKELLESSSYVNPSAVITLDPIEDFDTSVINANDRYNELQAVGQIADKNISNVELEVLKSIRSDLTSESIFALMNEVKFKRDNPIQWSNGTRYGGTNLRDADVLEFEQYFDADGRLTSTAFETSDLSHLRDTYYNNVTRKEQSVRGQEELKYSSEIFVSQNKAGVDKVINDMWSNPASDFLGNNADINDDRLKDLLMASGYADKYLPYGSKNSRNDVDVVKSAIDAAKKSPDGGAELKQWLYDNILLFGKIDDIQELSNELDPFTQRNSHALPIHNTGHTQLGSEALAQVFESGTDMTVLSRSDEDITRANVASLFTNDKGVLKSTPSSSQISAANYTMLKLDDGYAVRLSTGTLEGGAPERHIILKLNLSQDKIDAYDKEVRELMASNPIGELAQQNVRSFDTFNSVNHSTSAIIDGEVKEYGASRMEKELFPLGDPISTKPVSIVSPSISASDMVAIQSIQDPSQKDMFAPILNMELELTKIANGQYSATIRSPFEMSDGTLMKRNADGTLTSLSNVPTNVMDLYINYHNNIQGTNAALLQPRANANGNMSLKTYNSLAEIISQIKTINSIQ